MAAPNIATATANIFLLCRAAHSFPTVRLALRCGLRVAAFPEGWKGYFIERLQKIDT